MKMRFSDTLLNDDWLREHEDLIKETLPDTWTHFENFNPLHLGYRLKSLGVEWWSAEELARIVGFLEAIRFLERKNDVLVRANPARVRYADDGDEEGPSLMGILVLVVIAVFLYLLLR